MLCSTFLRRQTRSVANQQFARYWTSNPVLRPESNDIERPVHSKPYNQRFFQTKLECHSNRLPVDHNIHIHYLEYPKVGCANNSYKSTKKSTGMKTLVLIHGSYQTAYTYDELINCMDELSPIQPLRVLSVDLRGHGDSSWSPDGIYTLQILRNDIGKLLDGLDVENYYLLGNGLGSLVSLDLASARGFTADLLGLCTIEVPSSPKKLRMHDNLRYNASFSSFEDFVDFCMELNPNTTEKSVRKRLEMAIREDPHSGVWKWKRDPRFNFDTDIFQSELELLVSKVAGLSSSTKSLVVRGEHSKISSPRSTELLLDTLNEDEKKATSITLPGGHVLHGDAPKMLAKNVLSFMDLL